MTTSTTTAYSAAVVLNALALAGGRHIDDHTGKEAIVRHAAVFKREGKDDVIVPILSGTYFCLNDMYLADDGKVHLSKWSVGGVIEGNKLGLLDSVAHFNEMYGPSKQLVGLSEFNPEVGKPAAVSEKPFFLRREAFYSGNTEGETHDAEGTIFYRNSYHNTISDKPAVDWQIARATGLKPNDVYVREYTEEGKIRNYVHLPVMEKLIEYSDFCNANGIQCAEIRNLDAIKAAIAQFYQLRGIIC